ncbi:MAG: ANTAR domain-containing protein [Marmoricola sp.]|nr:ANTAR domain-containing protein [Marmoricola sp.]
MPDTSDNGVPALEELSLEQARDRVVNLQLALEHRMVIGVACGILMERFEQDRESAVRMLKRLSSERNVKLYALAEELAATGHLAPVAVRTQPDEE